MPLPCPSLSSLFSPGPPYKQLAAYLDNRQQATGMQSVLHLLQEHARSIDSRRDVGHLEELLDLAVLHLLAKLGEDILNLADGDEARVLFVEDLEGLGELG